MLEKLISQSQEIEINSKLSLLEDYLLHPEKYPADMSLSKTTEGKIFVRDSKFSKPYLKEFPQSED